MGAEGRGILVAGSGTSCPGSVEADIGGIERAVKAAFPEYKIRRAFTSRKIIRRLQEQGGPQVDHVEVALEKAAEEGIRRLVVLPVHLMAGFAYRDLAAAFKRHRGKFGRAALAAPLLSREEDYVWVVRAITGATRDYDDGETAVCFMGHGTEAGANAVYGKLQEKLAMAGYLNYYIGTVKAEPSLEDVAAAVVRSGRYSRAVLEPLMAASGNHAWNDMAGDGENSWKNMFEKEGCKTACILRGLGQISGIQALYAAHAKDAARKLEDGFCSCEEGSRES